VNFSVPSDAGSSFATFSLLFGVNDATGTFFGTRLFFDGTQAPWARWTANAETFGSNLNKSFAQVPIQPGDQLRADYFFAGLYTFAVTLTNVNTGASNTNNAVTAVGFTQLYFAFDNPWIGCFNYPKEGVAVFNNFNLTCFDGVGTSGCTDSISWTTGVIKPACSLAAHVDQYPKQVSLTWSTKQQKRPESQAVSDN